jgi:hypothetical protein
VELNGNSFLFVAFFVTFIRFQTRLAYAGLFLFAASVFAAEYWGYLNMPEALNYQFQIIDSIIALSGAFICTKRFRIAFLVQSALMFLAALDDYLYEFHNVTTLIYSSHNYTIGIINILILGIIIGGNDGGNTNKRTRRGYYRRSFYALQTKN